MDKDLLLGEYKETSYVLGDLFLDTLSTALGHINAIFADEERESLHQYRINIRKARSVLGEFKMCMDKDIYRLLKTGLKNLVSHTNELRDMDIFLKKVQRYKSILPQNLQKNLLRTEEKLFQKRDLLLEEVKKEFISEGYQKSVYVAKDLVNEQKYYSEYAKNDICTVSRDIIKKRVKELKKMAKDISKKSESSDFHEIRLSLKKLRYCIESFAGFYESKKIPSLLNKLKSMQDSFGEVQDKEIEVMWVKEYFKDDADFCKFLVPILKKESLKEKKRSSKKLDELLSLDIKKVIFC